MVRFHPQWHETRELLRAGTLGRISHAHIAFGYNNTDPSDIRNTASAGGGALYDIGCYAIVAARWFMDAEPTRVAAAIDRDPTFGTDRVTSGIFDFSDGRACTFAVSTQSVYHQRVHVYGTDGRLEITIPFNQLQDDAMVYFTHFGTSVDGLDATRHDVAMTDQYQAQADAFSRQVRTETPTDAPLRDAITNMGIIDAVFRAAQSGRFETI